MNTFFPHCPLRQEHHYWLDTRSGSTSLHYYAPVDTGLTKRNLSSICLSGRAESGTAVLAGNSNSRQRWIDTQVSWRLLTTLQPPLHQNHQPPHYRCIAFPTSHIKETLEWVTEVQRGTGVISNCILYSKENALGFLPGKWYLSGLLMVLNQIKCIFAIKTKNLFWVLIYDSKHNPLVIEFIIVVVKNIVEKPVKFVTWDLL